MRKRGTRGQQHYRELRRRHFIHEEAKELANVRTLRYAEVRRMTATRQLLWNGFRRVAPELDVGTALFNAVWRQYVKDWYIEHRLDTYNAKMERVVSPWSWFDVVSYSLSEEMRYTKNHRRKSVLDTGDKESASKRARRTAWIHQLKETLTKYPDRAPELVPRIIRLGGRVSTQWRRRAGVA